MEMNTFEFFVCKLIFATHGNVIPFAAHQIHCAIVDNFFTQLTGEPACNSWKGKKLP
jgi:hypothetical protein